MDTAATGTDSTAGADGPSRAAPAGPRVTDAVVEELRDAVLAGEITPGSKLSVPALAERFDVSRSPVREAVARLIADGLAVENPRRGAVVATISPSDLAELYEVRSALEGVVTRLAVERNGPGLADELDRVLAAHRAAIDRGDSEGARRSDAEFHQVLRRASRHEYAISLLDRIQSQVKLAMRTTMVTAGPERAWSDHRAIATAVRLEDAELAERRARGHVARLRDALRERPD